MAAVRETGSPESLAFRLGRAGDTTLVHSGSEIVVQFADRHPYARRRTRAGTTRITDTITSRLSVITFATWSDGLYIPSIVMW